MMFSSHPQRSVGVAKPTVKRGRHLLLVGSIIALSLFVLLDDPAAASRRVLVANTPITRQVRTQFQELQSLADNIQVDKEQPFNILALGGSVTWAEGLNTRTNSYPHVLGRLLHPNPTVDNLAIKAEGAAMPARCLETLTSNSTQGFVSGDVMGMKEKPYHLILLEFSLTGPQEMNQLVLRLHQRYPDAVFVYVHLHTKASREEEFGYMLDKYVIPSLTSKKMKAHVFAMPWSQETQSWYATDGIHMNVLGHLMITTGILRMLQEESFLFEPEMAEWKIRDACVSWFLSGKLPTESCVWAGGHIAEFNPAGGKYAYEIREKATLTVNNPFPRSVPLGLTFMVRGEGGMYPRVLVDIEGRGPSPITLVPEQAQMAHLQMTQDVGLLTPGENIVHFEVIQKTPWPLRVTGFSLLYNTKDVQHEDIPITLVDGILDNVESEVGDLLQSVPAEQNQDPIQPQESEEDEEDEQSSEGSVKYEEIGLDEKRDLKFGLSDQNLKERTLGTNAGVRLEPGDAFEGQDIKSVSAKGLYVRDLKEPLSATSAGYQQEKGLGQASTIDERDLASSGSLSSGYAAEKRFEQKEAKADYDTDMHRDLNSESTGTGSEAENKYDDKERDLKSESMGSGYLSEKKYDADDWELKSERTRESREYDETERDLKSWGKHSSSSYNNEAVKSVPRESSSTSSSLSSRSATYTQSDERTLAQPSRGSSVTYLYDQAGAQDTMKAKAFMDDQELDRRLKLGVQQSEALTARGTEGAGPEPAVKSEVMTTSSYSYA